MKTFSAMSVIAGYIVISLRPDRFNRFERALFGVSVVLAFGQASDLVPFPPSL